MEVGNLRYSFIVKWHFVVLLSDAFPRWWMSIEICIIGKPRIKAGHSITRSFIQKLVSWSFCPVWPLLHSILNIFMPLSKVWKTILRFRKQDGHHSKNSLIWCFDIGRCTFNISRWWQRGCEKSTEIKKREWRFLKKNVDEGALWE